MVGVLLPPALLRRASSRRGAVACGVKGWTNQGGVCCVPAISWQVHFQIGMLGLVEAIKKPAVKRVFCCKAQTELLQFDFLVFHMLASFGVELHDRHFLGHGFLVFAGRVEVTSASCGFQLDFFASAFGCHGV